LRLVQESAAEIEAVLANLGFTHADYVISGIPFKTLPPQLCETVVRKTYSVLRPKGSFLVYQLSIAVLPYLEKVFGSVSRESDLSNIMPAPVLLRSLKTAGVCFSNTGIPLTVRVFPKLNE
jgi:phospholipid N-methyltransferase